MRYLSVCSGIEAASAAWGTLGWKPVAFSEVEAFPSAVLAARYPNVPNLGDMRQIDGRNFKDVDLLVGGTPCFPKGTLVLTPSGYRPIDKLKIGDEVISARGRIRKIMDTGCRMATVGRLSISGMAAILCTPNHPFLCRTSEGLAKVRADKAEGKPVIRPEPDRIPPPKMPEICTGLELAGWFSGCGHIALVGKSRTLSVILDCSSAERVEKFRQRFAGRFPCFLTQEGKVILSLPETASWLAANFGRGPKDRRIPYWLYRHAKKNTFLEAVAEAVGDTRPVMLETQNAAFAYGLADLTMGTVRENPSSGRYEVLLPEGGNRGKFRRFGKFTPEEGEVPVYNITVDIDHTYIVKGIAVKNCQAFSIAGQRRSLGDDRGNLALKFVDLANDINPAFVLWENVTGVLSVKDNAFGCFIGALAGTSSPLVPPKGGWTCAGVVMGAKRNIAWRILDAQYFGLAQRRRRVFVLACPTGGHNPAKILFEWGKGRLDTPPDRNRKRNVCGSITSTMGRGGFHDREMESGFLVAGTMKSMGSPGRWENSPEMATAGCIIPPAVRKDNFFSGRTSQTGANGCGIADNISHTLNCLRGQAVAVKQTSFIQPNDLCATLLASGAGAERPAGIISEADFLVLSDREQSAHAVMQNQEGEIRISEVCGTLNQNSNATGRNAPLAMIFHGSQYPCMSAYIAPALGRNNGLECCLLQPMGIPANASEVNELNGMGYVPDIVSQAISAKWAKGSSGPAGDEHHHLIVAPLETTPYAYNASRENRPVAQPSSHSNEGRKEPIAIQSGAIQVNMSAGPQGKGFREDGLAYTLEARSPQYVLPINLQVAVRHNRLGERTGLGIGGETDPAFTIQSSHSHAVALMEQAVAVSLAMSDSHGNAKIMRRSCPTVAASKGMNGNRRTLIPRDSGYAVRRLCPAECEILMGFPKGYTDIEFRGRPAADGPRYKALGNSMAVSVMRWIGERIAAACKENPLDSNAEEKSPSSAQ